MFPRRTFPWRPVPRRLLAAAALLAYLAAALGLPLPPPVAVEAGGGAFACQGRLCGCRTAEDCSHHCCCHAAAPSCPHCAARAARDEECPHCSGKDPTAVCRHGMTHSGAPWHPVLSALGCRGEVASWVFVGAVPAVPPAGPALISPVASGRLTPGDLAAARVSLAPPLPPPRLLF